MKIKLRDYVSNTSEFSIILMSIILILIILGVTLPFSLYFVGGILGLVLLYSVINTIFKWIGRTVFDLPDRR
jgi:hypothetical protein